jgi:predicted  nucleic acid-binding Zn-ribbon protein
MVETDIREREAVSTKLLGREDELRKQAMGAPAERREALQRQAADVQSVRKGLEDEIKPLRRRLGALRKESERLTDWLHEPSGKEITGLGKRPETRTEQLLGHLRKQYDPQRLFYEGQMLMQGY